MVINNVYVLGSGFSASMGLPTLVHLFRDVMDFPGRPGENDKENILRALAFLYPHFTTENAPCSFPPYEEFLSIVAAAKDFSSHRQSGYFDLHYWSAIEKSAIRLLSDYIAHKSSNAQSLPLLAAFLDRLQDGDVIITFNWDNIIERALYARKRKINFEQRTDEGIALFKLHGSISWGRLPEGVVFQEGVPDIHSLSNMVHYMGDYRYFDFWDSLDIPPLIVPPMSSKSFSSEPFFSALWSEAFYSLIGAKNIAVIGYSVPHNDLQARTLLVSALNVGKRYTVVDPDVTIGGKYYSLVSPNIRFIHSYFSEQVLKEL
ncbi:MAG: hypothetical protein AB1553_16100 [Nitrospirota bacterium]